MFQLLWHNLKKRVTRLIQISKHRLSKTCLLKTILLIDTLALIKITEYQRNLLQMLLMYSDRRVTRISHRSLLPNPRNSHPFSRYSQAKGKAKWWYHMSLKKRSVSTAVYLSINCPAHQMTVCSKLMKTWQTIFPLNKTTFQTFKWSLRKTTKHLTITS